MHATCRKSVSATQLDTIRASIDPFSPQQTCRYPRGCALPGKVVSMSAALTVPGSVPYEDKVIGSVLGAMCGDALGASVENWKAKRIQSCYKNGLTAYQHTDRGYGCYTDDAQMLLALAASLVNKRRCCAADAAHQYALAFDSQRGYGGSAVKIMLRLADGADPATTATQFLPGGSFGNGGAMRIAPVGLAYRNADLDTLDKAVRAALLCTHVHPLGIEGALALALAVAELSQLQPAAAAAVADGAGASGADGVAPQLRLLRVLRGKLEGRSEEMCGKLLVLEEALQERSNKPASQPWKAYFASKGWALELEIAAAVAPGFQIKATDAVAAALWAAVCHWDCPEDAVVAAVHYGGDTDTIASMTGAVMGAAFGTSWLPQHWLSDLENGSSPSFFNQPATEDGVVVNTTRDMGRDSATALAKLLAELDIRK